MTPDLNERWLHGLSPFDGLTVSPLQEDLVLLPVLRKALRGILDRLRQEYPDRTLDRADDWHDPRRRAGALEATPAKSPAGRWGGPAGRQGEGPC